MIEDIKQEIPRLNDLRQPFIQKIYGFANSDTELIIISKYYENGSLSTIMFFTIIYN